MRPPIVPSLIILGIAGVAMLVLLIVQSFGLRGDLDAARQEIETLHAEVDALERGVPMSELSMEMAELENEIRDWVVAFSSEVPARGDPSSPAGGGTSIEEQLLDGLDRVLARIDDLDARIDGICENVPVC